MKTNHLITGFLLCLLVLGHALTVRAGLPEEAIPEALAPWQDWVLHGHEEALCPSQFNDGQVVRCQWPARLNLDVTADGGRFEQSWLIFASSWVQLPGSLENWPDAVAIDSRSAAVINREGKPMVSLAPGQHFITGRFFWRHLPEVIFVPPSLGLLSMTLEGRPVRLPRYDEQGRLWLRPGEDVAQGQEKYRLQVFRLFTDSIPMQVTTLLRLEVSGPGRELVFPNGLLANGIAMEVDSRLPVRVDNQGRVTVQARAGKWEIRVHSRLAGQVMKIETGPAPYENEIWSFEAQHHLRMVELEGLPQVEPSRTEMPLDWQRWPAFKVIPNAALNLKEIRRGDPDPAPNQLSLQRVWWLDFDGEGFTVHDQLNGTLNRQWTLAMQAPMQLGRVAVDGQDRLITRQDPQGDMGVELRGGHLNLEADSRLPKRPGPIAALGWNCDIDQVSGVLHLPPGWDLIGTTGIDQISDSWLQRWSLLDFFLVLIIALAVYKLRSWSWGLVALAAMALSFHEPGAPRLVWLHILAVMALLPLLHRGWARRLVMVWGFCAGVVLVVIMVPFMVTQLRWAFYPQLAPAYPQPPVQAGRLDRQAVQTIPAPAPLRETKEKRMMVPEAPGTPQEQAAMVTASVAKAPSVWPSDPNALIPTGPGLPDWRWQSVTLHWSGPVSKDQHIRLFLAGPLLNFCLCLLRVGLLAVLIWGLFDWRPWWQKIKPAIDGSFGGNLGGSVGSLMVVVMALALVAASGVNTVAAAEEGAAVFPPSALLDTLLQRLLAKPDCLPYCADISRLELTVSGDQLQIMLKVHAAELTAVPLPVNRQSWAPDQILLDNAPISGLTRDAQGQMWALVSAGLHTAVLLGDIGQMDVLQIPLPLQPHMVTLSAPGWDVQGLQPDGGPGAGLQLIRLQEFRDRPAAQSDVALPAFLNVQRRLQLGLTWGVITTVSRVTPVGAPIVVSIPLLENESVISEGLSTAQGEVLVTLAADQRTMTYQSTLEIKPVITLTAPRSVPWTEIWVLDASPVWHCDLQGIPVIHHQDGAGTWQPQWRPWPGEQVTIHVQRPEAVVGQQFTIDRADLVYIPGQRFAKGDLNLRMRTSRGEPYTLELPPRANLQQVTVDGASLPIRQDGAYVTIPLQAGRQTVQVQWHQPSSLSPWLRTPAVKIGHPAVNAHVSIQIPTQRWILLVGGPRWGPAVLFWSYLGVIVLAALALGCIPLSPLKSWSWLLLGLGLTQILPVMALIILGWLLALALRERRPMPAYWLAHNALQVALVLWTVAALVCLFMAVKAGLVGQPEMQIQGNQSYFQQLNWTQDHIAELMPQPWVVSLPVWIYRVLMLAWSLWLAWSLLNWLKWGWQCFSQGGVWRKKIRHGSETPQPTTSLPDDGAGG
jgi:hypothetical protein